MPIIAYLKRSNQGSCVYTLRILFNSINYTIFAKSKSFSMLSCSDNTQKWKLSVAYNLKGFTKNLWHIATYAHFLPCRNEMKLFLEWPMYYASFYVISSLKRLFVVLAQDSIFETLMSEPLWRFDSLILISRYDELLTHF